MRTNRALLTIAMLAAFAFTACENYDRLIELDSICDQKWADLDAQLQRRSDLIPNIVATVKAGAKYEQDTLTKVTEARAAATSIRLSPEDLQDPEKMKAFQAAQENLKGALSRLLVTQEQYPDLKANQNFHALMIELEGTENRILRARQEYNQAAKDYNAELGKVRGKIVKRATGTTFKPRVYYTASPAATAVPKVDL